MKKSNALKAACLGASLATAWSAGKAEAAGDFQVTADCNLSVSLTNLTLLIGDTAIPIPNDADGGSALRNAGTGLTWAGTICLAVPDNFATQPWVLMGTGIGSQASEVVVTFSKLTVVDGLSFEQAFSGSGQIFDEATIAGNIGKRDSIDNDHFLESVKSVTGQIPGSPATAVEFSNGVPIGTITVNVTQVPEPSSGLAVLGMGIASLFRRWRKR